MASDVGARKGNYRGVGFKVVYKDLGLQAILKKVSDFGFTKVRVGIVGSKARMRSGSDQRLTVAEVAMIHVLGLAPDHHIRRDFIGAPFRMPSNKKRMAFYFKTIAKATLQLKTSPALAMEQIGKLAVGIIRGGNALNTDPSNGASKAVGVRPLAESTIAKKRAMGDRNARFETSPAQRVGTIGLGKTRWEAASTRRVDNPENILNETGNLLAAVSYRVVRESGSTVDAGADLNSYDSYEIG